TNKGIRQMIKRQTNTLASICAAVALFAATCNAQATLWKMDKAHSQVTFAVAHFVVGEVTGVFKEFDVALAANKDDLTDAKIEATIKTASIDTGNDRRDNHV